MTSGPAAQGPPEPRLDDADDQARVRLLLEAAAAVTSEPTLDAVLSRIVRIASRLVSARYVALGVLDQGAGPPLRTFVHHGVSEEEVVRIGALPTGHGLLGLIIDRPVPVRLHDIAAHPASYGFPPHHPPMHSFLGVPVRVRGTVFGNLYLTEKVGGTDFTDGDEELVVALAATAGVAIENAELQDRARHRADWLAASADITAALVASRDLGTSLQLIADRARSTAGADVVWIVAGADPDSLEVRALSGLPEGAVASVLASDVQNTLTRDVVMTGEVLLSEDLSGDPRARVPSVEGFPALGPAVVVPFRSTPGGRGALALAWRSGAPFDPGRLDASLPAAFAEQATLALEVARARDGRERLALLEDRDRIARDLHDLVIQRLFATGLGLQGAARRVDDDAIAARLEQAVDELDATIRDVRRTIFDLGATEDSADLQSELTRMVERAGTTLKLRTTLTIAGPVRSAVDPEVAADLLAALGEALSNAGRHAEAEDVAVTVTVTLPDPDPGSGSSGTVRLDVVDDGTGMPASPQESGLGYMRDRAHRHQGTLRWTPGTGGRGTHLSWTVPLRA